MKLRQDFVIGFRQGWREAWALAPWALFASAVMVAVAMLLGIG